MEDCLWITKWDLNDPANLIGLPLYKQYKMSSGASPVNMCAHNIDHNTSDGYTKECKDWLKTNVWDTLNDKQKDHDVNADAIRKQLEDCTDEFKDKLEDRGTGNRLPGGKGPGTLVSFQNRFDPNWRTKWYYPFSMALKPRRRNPGTRKNLAELFKQIK